LIFLGKLGMINMQLTNSRDKNKPLKSMKTIVLDGKNLALADLEAICTDAGRKVKIHEGVRRKIEESHNFLIRESKKSIIYGINTGFGPMANHLLADNQVWELQTNLIRSHATGMGNPVHPNYVLGAMVIRLNTLIQGLSGVSYELVERLAYFINKRIIPYVPEHGAVGTSGDLVQLAHIALALIGEGRVWHENKLQKAEVVLAKLKVKPYALKPKEGLALINGTSFMSAIAAFVCLDAQKLISLSIKTGALSLELVRGYKDSLSERLHDARPHPGQATIANLMRGVLASSRQLRERHKIDSKTSFSQDVEELPEIIQEVYSLRCIAQILGPVHETFKRVAGVVEIEINSVTDNPIVDIKRRMFLHGGNFHGDYVASAVDQLKVALIKLTMLSERRVNFFLNRNINKFMPPFLNLKKPGLTLGLQGLQFVATSTTGNSQTLAYPMHIHSIPTNGDNQDIVSMGTDAALFSAKVSENAFIVLAIEAMVLAQAVDFTKISRKLSRTTSDLYKHVRKHAKPVVDDRYLAEEMDKLMSELRKLEPMEI
jgi:histidine ammonia-lyase